MDLKNITDDVIRDTLKQCNGNMSHAARNLNIKRTTLRDRLARMLPTNVIPMVFPQTPKRKIPKLATVRLDGFIVHETPIKTMFKRLGLGKNDIMRLVAMPDIHAGEHDPYAINAVNQFIRYYKPHVYVDMGDLMGFEAISHWQPRTADVRRVSTELDIAKVILDNADEALGKVCKYKWFLDGNHEDWLDQYLVKNIPELYDGLKEHGVELSVDTLLGLSKRGYATLPVNQILKIGHAHFIHGYYAGKQHAAKHLEAFGCNIFYAHLESVQVATKVSVGGTHMSACLGTMRKLDAVFLRGKPNNWLHAFGIFEFRYDGQFTPLIPVLYDHKFSYNGILFDGKAGI